MNHQQFPAQTKYLLASHNQDYEQLIKASFKIIDCKGVYE